MCSSRSRIHGGAGHVGKEWALSHALPHPASCHCHGGGITSRSQYPGRMEAAWELRRTTVSRLCTVQARLQAYLSTPVLGKLADPLQWCRVSAATSLVAHHITAYCVNACLARLASSFSSLYPMCPVLLSSASGYSDDIAISSSTLLRYRVGRCKVCEWLDGYFYKAPYGTIFTQPACRQPH